MVGPAPDKQIPSRPGCVEGVIDEVTSGKPGIWRTAFKYLVDAIPESTDQCFSVRLMYSIFHGFVYQLRIWRVLRKSRGQDGKPLKIEDLQRERWSVAEDDRTGKRTRSFRE